ncbi:MAG: recombinase family protein [Ruminococcus sp.]|nr:recombinase family protein [Ruminococcus sp.]
MQNGANTAGGVPGWRAALYIRLSKEDGDKAESNSITSQREILGEYLKMHPEIVLYDHYIDDGWSGTNFDRPAFVRMMHDIEAGAVNCVIVKDLSRFGRNYTDAGTYLDKVFVRLRVRFIALNNGLDTASEQMNAATQCISVGVTNVINESLAATTSVNVRGTLNVNRRQGKFIGSFPTYGYLKDPQDHHRLIIDDEAAAVVRMIFAKFIRGRSILGIARDLNEGGYPNPSAYKRARGMNFRHRGQTDSDGFWPDSTVRRILRNEMYIGNMVQGKTTTLSYKLRQCRAVPQSDWIVVEGTHEAIIDRDTFDRAQALLNRRVRTAPQKREADLFAGFVRCGKCGRMMQKKTNQHSYGTYGYYRCVTGGRLMAHACTSHSIRIDRLEEAVLTTVQKMIDTAIEMDSLLQDLGRQLQRQVQRDCAARQKNSHIQEREKLKGMMLELYPDWKSGAISREEYLALKESFTEKIASLERRIGALEQNGEDTVCEGENEFIRHFKQYGTLKALTRPILTELVEEILIFPDNQITIRFRFADIYQQTLEQIRANRDKIKTA